MPLYLFVASGRNAPGDLKTVVAVDGGVNRHRKSQHMSSSGFLLLLLPLLLVRPLGPLNPFDGGNRSTGREGMVEEGSGSRMPWGDNNPMV